MGCGRESVVASGLRLAFCMFKVDGFGAQGTKSV